jgi:thiosulfate/3-mercaptopyruvate sulfurtransferase
MALPVDPNPRLAQYAHPERLVTTEWLAANLGSDGLVVAESDEDILLYATGHIPGSVHIDWLSELNDPVVRDYLGGAAFATLCGTKGIARDTTIVIYGDKSNWWAAYALWVFTLFGHADVRLLDGGRDLWIAEGRALTRVEPVVIPADYPVVVRDDEPHRAFRDEIRAAIGHIPLIDVRSPAEYTGERTHLPDHPDEGALRGGHIPTAATVPWSRAAAPYGTFKPRAELEQIYLAGAGLSADHEAITYCRIGERSSHTWFVLRFLLGLPTVRNYDGSWTEWGSLVGAPIVKGDQPGSIEAA